MKRVLCSLLFCILSVSVLQSQIIKTPAPPYPIKGFNEHPTYLVVGVTDGDTVKIQMDGENIPVRLIGVDTPENVSMYLIGVDTPENRAYESYHREAKEFLENLLLWEHVYFQWDGLRREKDMFGRELAYLYRAPDGLFVNLEIVRQGYGRAYTKFPFKHKDLFVQFEKRAKEGRKGLWEKRDRLKQRLKEKIERDLARAKKKKEPKTEKKTDPTTWVYIIDKGEKYHREGCRHLKSKNKVTLKRAKDLGKEPCRTCDPPD